MKRFLILSDTHGDLYSIRAVINRHSEIQSIIHLGDYCKDASIIKSDYPELNIVTVAGNCDFVLGVPDDQVLEVEGKRIYITHGHSFGVKNGTSRLEKKAVIEKFDAVLFGHTHEPLLKRVSSIFLLNPGSLGYPRNGSKPSYAIMEVGENILDARILTLH